VTRLSIWLGLALVASVAHGDPSRPLELPPLTWDMTPETAAQALERAKMSPRRSETHAWEGGQPDHTVEPNVLFTPRRDWQGVAHWRMVGGPLIEITLTSTNKLTEIAVRDELAGLERRYGRPDRTSDRYGGHQEIWVRGGVWLVAFAGVDGKARKLSVSFRRDDRPLPPETR
jgi:hypothetical protein